MPLKSILRPERYNLSSAVVCALRIHSRRGVVRCNAVLRGDNMLPENTPYKYSKSVRLTEPIGLPSAGEVARAGEIYPLLREPLELPTH